MTSSRALRPWQLSGLPRPPLSARQCLRLTSPARLSAPATARTITSPPSPPSPPSGPPRGTYFSRRKLQHPLPPLPPWTNKVTRSTNMMLPCHCLPADLQLSHHRETEKSFASTRQGGIHPERPLASGSSVWHDNGAFFLWLSLPRYADETTRSYAHRPGCGPPGDARLPRLRRPDQRHSR